VRGLVNELYIDDLRCKTIHGQTGQVERGFIAGGKSYGYDIVKTDRGSDYQVNAEQAKWVRFIFEKFAAGWSTFQLCDHLNALGVSSPRNSTWMRSALCGSPRKGRVGRELREALSGDATAEARQIIAKLIGPIGIELQDGANFAAFDNVSERLLLSIGEVSPIVVAGVGFEPTTFGL
jgi:hypothetical protein